MPVGNCTVLQRVFRSQCFGPNEMRRCAKFRRRGEALSRLGRDMVRPAAGPLRLLLCDLPECLLCCGCLLVCGGCYSLAAITLGTCRRRQRRQRATARLQWFLHRKGWVTLTRQHLAHLRSVLSQHHSRDQSLIASISRQINMYDSAWDTGWKCGSCNKTVSYKFNFCGKCGWHWQNGSQQRAHTPKQRPSNAYPKNQDYPNWEWPKPGQNPQPKKPPKDRSKSARKEAKDRRAKEKKEKQNRGKEEDQPPEGIPLWPGGPPSLEPFATPAPSNAASSSTNAELLQALKSAYTNTSDMPGHVKSLIEKTEIDQSKAKIKDLHAATTLLGKSEKNVKAAQLARRTHRLAWLKHLVESIKVWEKQLEGFRQKEAQLQEAATIARKELSNAKQVVTELNAKATGMKIPVEIVAEDTTEDTKDAQLAAELEEMKDRLQSLLQTCAGAVGVTAIPVEDDDISDMEENGGAPERDKKRLYEDPPNPCAAGLELTRLVSDFPELPIEPEPDDYMLDEFAAARNANQLRWDLLQDECQQLFDDLCLPPVLRLRTSDAFYERVEDLIPDDGQGDLQADFGGAPDLQDQPRWIQDIHDILVNEGHVEQVEEGRIGYINTWCLRGPDRRSSEESRVFRITRDFQDWCPSLIQLWQDVLDPWEFVEFYLVRPAPLEVTGRYATAHLIVLQQPLHGDAAALVSTRWEHPFTPRVALAATFLPNTCNCDDVIGALRAETWCARRRCSCWTGDLEIQRNPQPAVPLLHGVGIVLFIPPAVPHGVPDDTSWLMQTQVPVQHGGQGDHGINQQIRQLRNPRLPHELNLAVVYQKAHRPRRLYIRMTTFEDMLAHIAALLHIDMEEIMNVYEITSPLHGEIEGAYALILKRPGDLLLASSGRLHLIDVEYHQDRSAAQPAPATRQVYVSGPSLARRHILELANLETTCEVALNQCIVYHNNRVWEFSDHRLRTLDDGQYFRILVPPTSDSAQLDQCSPDPPEPSDDGQSLDADSEASEDTDMTGYAPTTPDQLDVLPDPEREPDVDDDHSLLQTHMTRPVRPTMEQVAHTPWPGVSDHSQPPLRIQMGSAIRDFEWLDAHFCLPPFDLRWNPDFNWHPASTAWLDLLWLDVADWCYDLEIYFDGSANRKNGGAGIGVVLFANTHTGWKFGGGIAAALPPGTTSYKAELFAAICAAKLAHDTVKTVQVQWPSCYPGVTFFYDNQSVGRQGEGLWRAVESPHLVHLLRSLVRLSESRFRISLGYAYVPGHEGNPGNELANTLAHSAAGGNTNDDWSHFFAFVAQPAFVKSAEWFWFLFKPVDHLGWDGHDLLMPSTWSMVPDDCCTFFDEDAPVVPRTGTTSLRLSTCNVLTLKDSPPDGMDSYDVLGPSRQQTILQQFSQLSPRHCQNQAMNSIVPPLHP
eukprot:Skav227564  [mRNA]  locus=scaffold154:55393:60511:- [translate_table: standard]